MGYGGMCDCCGSTENDELFAFDVSDNPDKEDIMWVCEECADEYYRHPSTEDNK